MTTFDVAHIREQGQDMIIVPLANAFGLKSPEQQRSFMATLQRCANAAGLRGIVVVVWDDGLGRMNFIAPPLWHPFFQSIGIDFVSQNINKRLNCG